MVNLPNTLNSHNSASTRRDRLPWILERLRKSEVDESLLPFFRQWITITKQLREIHKHRQRNRVILWIKLNLEYTHKWHTEGCLFFTCSFAYPACHWPTAVAGEQHWLNNKWTRQARRQRSAQTAHVAWREIWAFVTLKVPIMITVFVNSACWTIRCDKNTLSKVSPFDRKSKRIQDISRLLSQMKRPFHVVTEGVNLILKNCFSHGKGQVQARFITSSPVVQFGWDFGGVLGD